MTKNQKDLCRFIILFVVVYVISYLGFHAGYKSGYKAGQKDAEQQIQNAVKSIEKRCTSHLGDLKKCLLPQWRKGLSETNTEELETYIIYNLGKIHTARELTDYSLSQPDQSIRADCDPNWVQYRPVSFHETGQLSNGVFYGKLGALTYLLHSEKEPIAISSGYHEIVPLKDGYLAELGREIYLLGKDGTIIIACLKSE
jgi:hypothetical protein